jgi:N-acetylneuraminic acid mutarotase
MNKCEVYDVASDTWTQIASLNTRRNFHTTIAFDNQALYVVAGFNGGQRTNLIERYDIRRRQNWDTLNLRIKENTNWICLEGCGLYQISNKHILIFGGFTTSDQKTNHCYLFNTSTNEIE